MTKLINEIKNLNGYILGVGILNNKILTAFEKNNNIEVNILTNNNIDIPIKSKLNNNVKKKKGKKIIIKKLKKYFKRHKPDYLICNIDDVSSYLKYFVKDSLYITKSKIYIYSDNKTSLDDILKRYKRYTKDAEIVNDYLLINTENYEPSLFKNMYYYILDTIIQLYEFIGNVLTS